MASHDCDAGHKETHGGDSEREFHAAPEDLEERRVLFAAIDSFHQYRATSHYNVTHRRRQNLYALPSSQWQILAAPPFSLLGTLSQVDDAIDQNANLADAIVSFATTTIGLPASPAKDHPLNWRNTAKPSDHAKAHSTLRQFYRDWSAEGFALEVKPLLDLILNDLHNHLDLPQSSSPSPPPSLLLPGAGLSRLLLALTLAGYHCTGNEISYHALLASNYILNHTRVAHAHTVFPFCTTFTNLASRSSQLRSYTVPDVHPATAFQEAHERGDAVGEMGMAAGDFVTSFGPRDADSAGAYDGVVSAYFIDTAPNLIRYIETIRHCLRPGGVWVNVGPLLWHFDGRGHQRSGEDGAEEDGAGAAELEKEMDRKRRKAQHMAREDAGIGEPGSFELSNEEVLLLVESYGFEILCHEILPADFVGEGSGGSYIQDRQSMMQSRYQNAHWVARKRSESARKDHQ